jgi:hypothetical protein
MGEAPAAAAYDENVVPRDAPSATMRDMPSRTDTLIRGSVAPPLREAGFRGSGSTFFTRRPGNVAVVNFQMSRDPGVAKFTINGGVYSARLGRSGVKRPSVWDCHYQVRVGQLLDPPRDLWWALPDPLSPGDAVVQEVMRVLFGALIPDLERHLDDSDLRDYWMARWLDGKASFEEIRYLSQSVDVIGPAEASAELRSIVEAGPRSGRLSGRGPKQTPSRGTDRPT